MISELTRPNPSAAVVRFLDELTEAWLSAVTVHELTCGLRRLPAGARRTRLGDAVDRLVDLYADRLLAVTQREAEGAGALRASAEAGTKAAAVTRRFSNGLWPIDTQCGRETGTDLAATPLSRRFRIKHGSDFGAQEYCARVWVSAAKRACPNC